jgi:hypothetical protein
VSEVYGKAISEYVAQRGQAMDQMHQQAMGDYQEQVGAATQMNIPIPMPPALPEPPSGIPAAFDVTLMPEWKSQQADDLPKACEKVADSCKDLHSWLKNVRRMGNREKGWADCQAYYDMLNGLSYDEMRRKSVDLLTKTRPDAELNPERQALVLPVIFEAVQIIGSTLFQTFRGTGTDHCELIGQEKNDIPEAIRVEQFMNYQYSHEIPTSDLFSDIVLDALITGCGVWLQTWDMNRNLRRCKVLDRADVWWDPADVLDEARAVVVRREISLAEAMRERAAGRWLFTDEAVDGLPDVLEHRVQSTLYDTGDYGRQPSRSMARSAERQKGANVNPLYKKLTLDIVMDTEPWRICYILNEKLLVGVSKPLIFADQQREIQARFPVSVFAPIRRAREIDGDSFVSRALDCQDMCNALLNMIPNSIKSSTQGFGITSNYELMGQPIELGKWHVSNNPQGDQVVYGKDASSQILSVVDWYTNRVGDRISGVTSGSRGEMQYAGMPATAVRDLIQQGGKRTSPQEIRAVDCKQDIDSVGITLNKLYLAPHSVFRVTGEDGIPRPMDSSDIQGVTGKDLVPTGFPGSMAADAQSALNEAAVLMQVGRDPAPILKLYFKNKYKGRINVDQIFPEDGVGHDPVQENMNMMNGMPVSRDPDDIDQYHVSVHMQMANDKNFMKAAQQNPQILMVLQNHIQEHMTNIQRVASLAAGVAPAQGMGSGSGASGQNTNPIEAQAKTDQEREKQMKSESKKAG